MPKARPTVSFADALAATDPRAGSQLKIVQLIDDVRAIKPEIAEQMETALSSGRYSARHLAAAINNTLAAFDIDDSISEGSVTKHPSYVKTR